MELHIEIDRSWSPVRIESQNSSPQSAWKRSQEVCCRTGWIPDIPLLLTDPGKLRQDSVQSVQQRQ